MKVLYIASNPKDASELTLANEITELQSRAVQASGEPVSFIFLPAVAFERLPLELHKHRPDIVHFSAHGKSGELLLSNQNGKQVRLTGEMLCEFLRYENPPKLIYLNACDSEQLAREVISVVSMAIGTTAPITNRAAWASAVVFYERLLMGMPVGNAYAAGKQMIRGMQNETASSVLEHVPGVTPSKQRLHSVPRLVAWPEDGKLQLDGDGVIALDLKLMGCPANTFQVIFFTDDKRFVLNEPPDDETDAAFLAGELCQLVRDTPRQGLIETDDVWPTVEEFRIFACGTTSAGQTFTVASTICTALKDYAAHVLRWEANDSRNELLSAVIERLENPNTPFEEDPGSIKVPVGKSAAVSKKSSNGKQSTAKVVSPSKPSKLPKKQRSNGQVPSSRKRTLTATKRAAPGPKNVRRRVLVLAKKAK